MVIDKAREEVYQLHLIDPNGPLEAHLPVPTIEPNRNPSEWGMPLLELCHKFILAEQKGLNKIQEIQQKTEMPNFFFKASIKHFDCNNKTWNSYVCVCVGGENVCVHTCTHAYSVMSDSLQSHGENIGVGCHLPDSGIEPVSPAGAGATWEASGDRRSRQQLLSPNHYMGQQDGGGEAGARKLWISRVCRAEKPRDAEAVMTNIIFLRQQDLSWWMGFHGC